MLKKKRPARAHKNDSVRDREHVCIVCMRERQRERREKKSDLLSVCTCVCACVRV